MLTTTTQGLAFTGDIDRFLSHEWLLTNSAGGFAMGTALGANTRRYHALLIAAANPPVDRVVVLHHLVEQLVLTHGDGATTTLEFGPMLFNDAQAERILAPDDTPMLQRFDNALAATWSYQYRDLTFTRRLVLHETEPGCTVHYDITGMYAVCEHATLTLRPFITLRGFHDLAQQHDAQKTFHTDAQGDTLRVDHANRSATYRMPGSHVKNDPQWWNNTQYPIEQRRGQGQGEDLYAPAVFTLDLPATDDCAACFTATFGKKIAMSEGNPTKRLDRISRITRALVSIDPAAQAIPGADDIHAASSLARAADDFIVNRTVAKKECSTIIAGYPWFADWGRDTFIALPGLLLCTGRHDEARDTLAAFAGVLRDGLVPNRFDDDDPTIAHYNTVDASLWFVHSALEYLEHTGDKKTWTGWLANACVEIIEGYRQGTHADGHDGKTRIDIAMQEDGLIAAGNAQSQLTWMDAAAPGPDGKTHVFTPRPGKCIEINALWYSALVRLSQDLPKTYKKERKRYADLAPRVCAAFRSVFGGEQAKRQGFLIDHVAPDGAGGWVADPAMRPNMMIACALKHSPVDPAMRKLSLAAVKEKLLTPVGLRTLPRDDPDYHPRYQGSAFERDGAYHRGTVWPWLIGPYAEALLRAGEFDADAKREAREAIAPLLERLTTTQHPGMIGQLHEIHEPEPPFAPRGCPAQAWSVAEVLRVWCLLQQHRE